MSNIKILVAAHKDFPMPENKSLYMPVLVGAKRNYKRDIHFQRDDEGENISYKNPNYNELTAVYWAWKNLKGVDAVGLVHYRRLFLSRSSKRNPLEKEEINELFKSSDVILPKKRHYYIETNRSHYIHAHNAHPLDETRKVIAKYYSDYLPEFDTVMKKRSAHMFNMFVMKKKYFDSYCEWLFDVLFKLEKRVDISDYSVTEARVYGYISELLMDVWISHNSIDFSEVKWKQLGKVKYIQKGINFLIRKFLNVNPNNSKTHF